MRSCAILALALTLAGLSSQPVKTASEQADELEQRAQAAAKAGDHKVRIAADLELFHLLNGSPIVVEALARAYASSGDVQAALAELNKFADLGQTDEALLGGSDKRYPSIQTLPDYKKVLARLAANQAPVSLSSVAFVLPDADLLPEDIDHDADSRSFLVTSILKRKIIRVQTDGSATDFAVSPDGWPMVAIKIDNVRRRVWATEVAFDGLAVAPVSGWGHSAVLCFDLRTGKLVQRVAGPAHSSLGDMVLARNGDPILSDGDKGILYRVSNGQMLEINKMDFISPQTATRSPSGEQLFVPDYVRGIARFDLKTGHVSWLNKDGADKVATNGIDGLYSHGHYLIATQNGSSPERVALFALDSTLTHIISTRVIEQAASPGCDPTHGVIVGNDFFYIANSGWAKLDERGKVKDGMKLTKAVVMSYKLP
jgi:sugar lactone lactonase YvrE